MDQARSHSAARTPGTGSRSTRTFCRTPGTGSRSTRTFCRTPGTGSRSRLSHSLYASFSLCSVFSYRTMLFSSRTLQNWFFAVVLLCSPVPHDGRPLDAISSRTRRSVSHTQLMHDKSRTLQDFRRRMWLQELLGVIHTAEAHHLETGGGSGLLGANPSTTGTTLQSKRPGGIKNLPISAQLEEEETVKYNDSMMKSPGRRKKKARSGKRREGEKRKRRARSLRTRLEEKTGSGLHRRWRSLLGS
ncbi:transcript variant X1 [Nothobranchius furzeri]|uniref:Transcript variant X1 n=1 Tax=Nothobranchius furzeri TaxID=105023 RepID=A0A9D3C074_NOTFU|nr:transcript variant X1 [Nothobranchius furzeri]